MSGFVAANPELVAAIMGAMATAIVALAAVLGRTYLRMIKTINERLSAGDKCFVDLRSIIVQMAVLLEGLCRAIEPLAENVLDCHELRDLAKEGLQATSKIC